MKDLLRPGRPSRTKEKMIEIRDNTHEETRRKGGTDEEFKETGSGPKGRPNPYSTAYITSGKARIRNYVTIMSVTVSRSREEHERAQV